MSRATKVLGRSRAGAVMWAPIADPAGPIWRLARGGRGDRKRQPTPQPGATIAG